MAFTIQQNASNASQADVLMDETGFMAVSQPRTAMDELTGAMEAIRRSSDETGRIIKTIDEITSQTNLLALKTGATASSVPFEIASCSGQAHSPPLSGNNSMQLLFTSSGIRISLPLISNISITKQPTAPKV